MPDETPSPLISISIDLVGSTNLKRIIHEFSTGDNNNIIRLYKEIARHLYDIEMGFYYQAVLKGLDLKRFFVVKTIGDEIWILYNLAEIETGTYKFNEVFHSIYESLITFVSNPLPVTLTTREYTDEEENDVELQAQSDVRIQRQLAPVKAYVDYIDLWQDASSVRYDTLIRRLGSLFPSSKGPSTYSDKDVQSVINRLSIGTVIPSEKDGGKIKIINKTDPIGFEIDHFFRCTKAAKPCVLTVGNNLIGCLRLDKPWAKKYDQITPKAQLPYGTDDHISYDYYDIIWEQMPSEKLKGIGNGYQVCNIFQEPLTFNRVFHKPIIKDEVEIEILKDTIELLKKVGIQGMDPKED